MPYANLNEAFLDGSSVGSDSTLASLKNPFKIANTDPADDFDRIAENYVPDNYNITYSGKNEWDILDEDIRGLSPLPNQSVVRNPDHVMPISTNRRSRDRIWDRPTGAYIEGSGLDVFKETKTDCSDQTCLQFLDHILECEKCATKFRKLMDLSKGSSFPEINLQKLMFWIVIVILIIAVYELLNSIFRRLTILR